MAGWPVDTFKARSAEIRKCGSFIRIPFALRVGYSYPVRPARRSYRSIDTAGILSGIVLLSCSTTPRRGTAAGIKVVRFIDDRVVPADRQLVILPVTTTWRYDAPRLVWYKCDHIWSTYVSTDRCSGPTCVLSPRRAMLNWLVVVTS